MPNNKPGSRLIKAAGGVAWRPGPDGEPEILLVHRTKYDDWSLPKGKAEPGEPLPVTAVREVLEEGGARPAPRPPPRLGPLQRRRPPQARALLGGPGAVRRRARGTELRGRPGRLGARLPRRAERVSYSHDHGVLADFAAAACGTVPLILLRHAKACRKSGWKRADSVAPARRLRPADAKALADLLTCFAARPRLISSPAVRCTETLRPLARSPASRCGRSPRSPSTQSQQERSRLTPVPALTR